MALHSLSLCTGAAGLDLGLKLAMPELRTVAYVEIEAYAAALLVARMEEQTLDSAPIWDDLRTFDGKPWRGKLDIISAGYPCQPFSFAGKGKADSDERYLWPDVRRILLETQSPYLFCENVPGHLNRGFEQVCLDLESMGYRVAAGLFSAAEFGAPHKRERLYFLAGKSSALSDPHCEGLAHGTSQEHKLSPGRLPPIGMGEHGALAYANRERELLQTPPEFKGGDWLIHASGWPAESPVCGMAHGSAYRMDRLRLLGNAVIPAVASRAFIALLAELTPGA